MDMASVDFADKPAVRLNLDLQRIDLAVANAASFDQRSVAGRSRSAVERQADQSGLVEFSRCRNADHRCRSSHRSVPICAGVGRRDSDQWRVDDRLGAYRHLWRTNSGHACCRCLRRRAQPRSSCRPNRRAGVAVVVRRRLLRWDRRQHGGKNRRTRPRYQSARHHVDAARCGGLAGAGWRASQRQHREDDPFRGGRHAQRLAGKQSREDRSHSAQRILPPRRRQSVHGQSAAAWPAGARDRRRHRRHCGAKRCSSGSSRSSCSVSKGRAAPPIRSASACRLWCRGPGVRRASIRRWPASWTTRSGLRQASRARRGLFGIEPGLSGIARQSAAPEHRML